MQLIIFSELAITAGIYSLGFFARGLGVIFGGRPYVDEVTFYAQRKSALLFFSTGGAFVGAAKVFRDLRDDGEFLGIDSPLGAIAAGVTIGVTAGASLVYGMQAAEQSPMLNRVHQRIFARPASLLR